jgi:hypothetical protein
MLAIDIGEAGCPVGGHGGIMATSQQEFHERIAPVHRG